MKKRNFHAAGSTEGIHYAMQFLKHSGILFSATQAPTHLLLDVPSFQPDGFLRGGNSLEDLLRDLPKDIAVIGGNLHNPILDGYNVTDLLQDPIYLAQNAAITAHCAVQVAQTHLPVTLDGCPILILGWGRIGKCLAQLLTGIDAEVSVFARKKQDKAMLAALGFQSAELSNLTPYRVIFNTVPAPILSAEQLAKCRPDCVKIELASTPGMDGDGIIPAKGLPGILAPESSGKLIAQTILRLLDLEENL